MNLSTNFWGGAAAPYEIEQSLRFDGGASLSRSGTIKGASTFSVWIKRSKLNDTFGVLGLREGSTSNYKQLFFEGSSYDSLGFDNSSGGNAYSNNKFRDPSAWFHVVVVSNTTGTGSKMYINGEEVSYRIQTTTTSSDTTGTIYIGALNGGGSQFNGYLAELHIVDSALEPTDFAEEDENGVWRPIEFTGSYGSNGVYLKFDPSATNGIGHDHSGNGNDFTPTGFTTSGTGTDVMSDTPTTNYCTLNPIGTTYSLQTPTDGNLKTDSNAYGNSTEGTFGIPKDGNLYYFEGTMTRAVGDGGTGLFFGCHTQGTTADPNSTSGKYFGPYGTDGGAYDGAQFIWKYDSYTGSAKFGHINAGTVLAHAIKYDSGTWKYWYRQGSNGWHYWNGSSWVYNTSFDETEPTGSNSSVPESETLVPIGNNIIFNFGQRDFEYTPPTGAKYLRSSDLPAPDIADGSKYFDTLTWTGDSSGATRTFSGLAFQPDLVWAKGRNQAISHQLTDAVRGAGATSLRSDDTRVEGADGTASGYLSAFTSDGFTSTSSSTNVYYNTNTYTYVAWNWKAGGTGSSNTAGSITSTVSANPTAGFSIVTYTGTGSAATVGHGLGVAPNLIIVKSRNYSPSSNWKTYWSVLGDKYIDLNDPNQAYDAGANIWNDTAPTSTVFSIGTDSDTNYSSSTTYVAYCFAEVEGYSKFGSYTGNGSLDGPFVFCGFRPAWVMIKRTDGTGEWFMVDTPRNPYNPADDDLFANASTQETASSGKDLLSNGFKIRENGASMNASGGTFIFMAFAEHPTGGSGVSPATAR
jgi:hypothetical protein